MNLRSTRTNQVFARIELSPAPTMPADCLPTGFPYPYSVINLKSPEELVTRKRAVKTSTTTTVMCSPAHSSPNQTVIFKATVKGDGGAVTVPTGTVMFKVYYGSYIEEADYLLNETRCFMAMNESLNTQGVATGSTATLTKGHYTVMATYNGDSNYNGSFALKSISCRSK